MSWCTGYNQIYYKDIIVSFLKGSAIINYSFYCFSYINNIQFKILCQVFIRTILCVGPQNKILSENSETYITGIGGTCIDIILNICTTSYWKVENIWPFFGWLFFQKNYYFCTCVYFIDSIMTIYNIAQWNVTYYSLGNIILNILLKHS